jgi:hypothetical protein
VKESDDKARIDEYIRGPQGLVWSWLKGSPLNYGEDSKFNWCGAFAAFVYQDVHKKNRVSDFASTNRLWNWSEGNERRIPISPSFVEPGDIVLVGPDTGWTSPGGVRKKYGRHVAIVESVDAANRLVNTIEGNTIGEQPDGKKRKGVGKDQRYFPDHPKVTGPDKWRIVAVIRPLESDYATGAPGAGKGIVSKMMGATSLLAIGLIGVVGLFSYAVFYARR